MNIYDLLQSSILLFVLLNPFLMSIYLMDLIESMKFRHFALVLLRSSLIAATVFAIFALGGEKIFTVIGTRFAAFLFFGGVIFLLIAVRFVFYGSDAIKTLRGNPEHIEGSISLPFMIGPGTVSASVLLGNRHSFAWSFTSILVSMLGAFLSLLALKYVFDLVKKKYAKFVEKYIDIVGRIGALYIGTVAIEMIFQALELLKNDFLK